ncbi:MAG TPA: glycosyltransferase family 2 protein [Acidimicrobiales bacterium]|nr:glycosyltransferase family 2 protein [Acidimicrobiales bacterium]
MTAARPLVDVGVVTWNTADLTATALRRLLDTEQGADLRVLVRDNGSTDGTVERLAASVPEADVDAGEENLGFAAGMNTLLARSTAPWFLALNSDAWPAPGAVGRLVQAAVADPGAAAVAPRLERPDGSLEHSTHPFPSLVVAAATAAGAERWLPRPLADRLLLEPAWDHRRARDVDWAVGAALLMRRGAVEQVGGFDERFFMYVEDLAWCHRARRHGWRIRFEPAAVVVHVGNASGRAGYGERRTRTYLESTHRWYREVHGPARSALYRALGAAGAARHQLAARRRGDEAAADWWRAIRRVHLAPVPVTDTSRPVA